MTGSDMDEQAKREVVQLLLAGEKIQAIKRIRQETGLGLTEAKAEADRMETELRGADPSARNLDKRSGCSGLLLLVAAAGVALLLAV